MNAKPKTLDISIMGRAYKVAFQAHEREALLEAAAYLDQKMNEIKSAGKTAQTERIAVMAALNIANEWLSLRNTPGGSNTDSTTGSITGAPEFDLDNLKRRMAAMQSTLDQALAQQEKLL